ncbi:MAG: diaminobutyrate acetyltransferase [Thiotrichales bacterium]|nr:diaminobutyrate acetyltransferase [Thiotrichales bacterium]
MEQNPNPQSDAPFITFRHPVLADGLALYELVKACPPLDLNSSYLYFLQASHFSETCLIAEQNDEIVGFVSGYRRPDAEQDLFIWQVAVAPEARGQGLGKQLVSQLIAAQIKAGHPLSAVSCTISSSNLASQGLFKSLAEQHRLLIERRTFIKTEQFGAQAHEAEDSYTLSAANHQLLNEFLTF